MGRACLAASLDSLAGSCPTNEKGGGIRHYRSAGGVAQIRKEGATDTRPFTPGRSGPSQDIRDHIGSGPVGEETESPWAS